MLEMVAITFDGGHVAERTLSDLRAARDDPWLSEVAVVEHGVDGRYSVKAKNPDVDETKSGKGAAIGGLTGLFVGAIGGPFGLLLWSGIGAGTGAAIGESKESAFLPVVEELKAKLPPDSSLLALIGETPALDGMESAVGAPPRNVLRRTLTSDQAKELADSAA